jgi:cytoskeleton protein RodZ
MKVESLSGEVGKIATEGISRSPGELLRQERSRRGLKEMEVAERLHITKHYVTALESDSYEKLPGAIFERGYLKKYAELLGLDADQIVDLYNEIESQKLGESDDVNRRGRNKLNFMWILFSAIGLVFLSLVIWLYSFFSRENSAASEPQVNYQTDKDVIQDTFSIGLESEEDNKTPYRTNLLTSVDSVGEIEDESSIEPSVDNRVIFPPKGSERSDASLADVRDASDMTYSTATQLNANPRIDSGGSDFLLVFFKDQSLIEIVDGSQTRIYRDIRSSGDVLEIFGRAPFDILIGDATHTNLVFNGVEIDVSSNIRVDHSARLVIGN